MPQIGTIKLKTKSGIVNVPVYSEGDSGSGVYEFLKVQTESGTGFIALVEPAEAEYNYIRVQTESNGVVAVHNETALGITEIQNYIEDDWNDNNLQNRDNSSDGVFAHPQSNEAGDILIGRYRPEWVVENGSPSASNQRMEVPDSASNGAQRVRTACGLNVGSWKWGHTAESGSFSYNDSGIRYSFMLSDATNFWNLMLRSNANESHLRKVDSGSESTNITGPELNDGNTYTVEVKRSSYGNWVYIVDGTSKGTTTDTFIPSGTLFFDNSSGNDSQLPGNLGHGQNAPNHDHYTDNLVVR